MLLSTNMARDIAVMANIAPLVLAASSVESQASRSLKQDDGSDHGTVVLSTAPDSAGLRHRPRSPIMQRMASQRSARSDAGSDLAAHRSLSSALSVDATHPPEVLLAGVNRP